jgi:hypothetical protein
LGFVSSLKGFAIVPYTNGRYTCVPLTRFWLFGGAMLALLGLR